MLPEPTNTMQSRTNPDESGSCAHPLSEPQRLENALRRISELEAQLAASAARHEQTIAFLPIAYCELNLQLRITRANKHGLALFGITQAEVEQGPVALSFFPPRVHDDLRQRITKILSGDFGALAEYPMLRKDGSEIIAAIKAGPTYNQGVLSGVQAYMIDITEQKVAQDRLAKSEERFRKAFAVSPTAMALFTSSGQIYDRNAAFERLSSACHRDAEAATIFELIPPLRQRFDEVLAVGSVRFEATCEMLSPETSSTFRTLDLTIATVGGSTGSGLYVLQALDLTDLKRLERLQLAQAQRDVQEIRQYASSLQDKARQSWMSENIATCSPQFQRLLTRLPDMADAEATVLIAGESGTGKELVARALHEMSVRKAKPFVAINCTALPEALLESELFGYSAGAFTDAKKDTQGKFALADGGTLFLDEIGDISPSMQAKLLRVLQERTFFPLGSNKMVRVDVRIVAATNKNLSELVAARAFREDLYYRLRVLRLDLPPLRDRRCDIPLLCGQFIRRFNATYGKNVAGISQDAMDVLLGLDYAGNVRELQNIIEHAFVFCNESCLQAAHLPSELVLRNLPSEQTTPVIAESAGSLRDRETQLIIDTLKAHGGNKAAAAKTLGIHKSTLFRKLRDLDARE